MDKFMSGLKSNPDVVKVAAEKAGDLVEDAVKKALGGKEGEKGKTEAEGHAGVKVEGKAGESGAKVEGKGDFGLGDALGAFQGEKKDSKKDSKDGGRNVKNVMGAFGL